MMELKDTIDSNYTNVNPVTNNNEVSHEENAREIKYNLWSLHRNLSNMNNDKKIENTNPRSELRVCLNKPVININEDSLKHWEEIKASFSSL